MQRGICSLPYVRQSDGEVVYFPSNLVENLFVSNGMSAGNTLAEAQVQSLSEIFERAVKREMLEGEIRSEERRVGKESAQQDAGGPSHERRRARARSR